jgi:hypothetical protein
MVLKCISEVGGIPMQIYRTTVASAALTWIVFIGIVVT